MHGREPGGRGYIKHTQGAREGAWETRLHQTYPGCTGGSLGDEATSNIPRVHGREPGGRGYIKHTQGAREGGAWGTRVTLKFCMFCPTESIAQTDSQGMQGKISIEDFLGIE